MRRTAIGFAITLGAFVLSGGTAAADDPPAIVLGPDGKTAAVFGYADAVRERVFIPVAGVDQDADGVEDRVAADIIRPAATESGLQVPAIIDASPYFTSVGRGEPAQYIHTTAAGVADSLPLFYDNYFVPRGYAVILAQANGTGFSTGCPLHGGPGDIASMKAVIDWLQGRVPGYDGTGAPLVADWDNGKAAMIGKSYDGTLANGVAATGVDGLTTIVPIAAISDWYDYSRSNGIRTTGTHYPNFLSTAITQNASALQLGVEPFERTALCAPTRAAMNAVDDDANADVNAFWAARDYKPGVSNVEASVLLAHGLNDDNVKPDQFSEWWAGLAANGVPRKLWLSQEGHVDPFDFRRAEWVDTLQRWFDFWLQGVPNGIMDEPRVTIERSTDVFVDAADWPLPGTANVDVFLQATAAGAAGTFGLVPGGSGDALTFTDVTNQNESTMLNNPSGSQANRLTFLSPVLTQDLRVSGTPLIDISASFNKTTGNLGAILVDYADFSFTRPSRSSDGTILAATQTCWGESTATDSACFREHSKPTVNVTSWRVSKGILDAENRSSLVTPTPLVPGDPFGFTFPALPVDYVFPAGHRVGVVLVSNYTGYTSTADTSAPTAQVTVDTDVSKVVLPIVGGAAAALASGGFTVDVTAPVLDLPDPITVEATGPTTAVTYAVTASDDRDASPAVVCTAASGSAFPVGTTTVGCTATDATGNVASGSFTVTAADRTAPALHLPDPITATATSASGTGVVITYDVSATDVVDPTPAVSCAPGSGATFPVGRTPVRCKATDASGNVRNGAFDVTIVDGGLPVLDLPAAIRVSATSSAGASVVYEAGARDAVDPRPRVSCLPASGSTFPLGTTTVRCTATDASGNVAAGSFEITVADTIAPVLDVPAWIRLDATSRAGATVAYTTTVRDAVDPRAVVSCLPASGATFRIGTTVVRCAATDAAANTSRRTFAVHVQGAAEQLNDLRRDVAGAGRGKSLQNRIDVVRARLADGKRAGACAALDAFRAHVRAQAGKSLSRAKATGFLRDAARIDAVMGC